MRGARKMKISVIICTYNGAPRLPMVLESLAAQELPPSTAWELIVVDNASTDNTRTMLDQLLAQFPADVKILEEKALGKANALKTAFRFARGEIFCIVDDDNLLAPGYLANGARFLDENPDAAMIGGRRFPRFPNGVTPPVDFDTRYAAVLACRDLGSELIWDETPPGAGQMGRVQLMRGIYDFIGTRLADRVGSGVGCGEDLEKGAICRRLGWRTVHVPTMRMQHVMTAKRLSEDYIDCLWCAAISVGPWLKLAGGERPQCIPCRLIQVAKDYCRSAKYGFLSLLPTSLHPNLKRARFCGRFYASRARGYAVLIRDRKQIADLLAAIEAAPAELRPPFQSIEKNGKLAVSFSGDDA